jgi:hypothetical protein
MAPRRRKSKRISNELIIELAMTSLVAVSLVFLGIDIFGHPTHVQSFWIEHIDLTIACIFLTEFMVRLIRAPKPLRFLTHNWYLLVAAIPISVPGTQVFRLLRLERVVRVVRIATHVVAATRH